MGSIRENTGISAANSINSKFDPRLPLLSPLFNGSWCGVIGMGGEPLEWLVKVVLAFRFSHLSGSNKTWEEVFPYFKETLLGKEVITLAPNPISPLPQIKEAALSIQSKIDIEEMKKKPERLWKHVASPSDWEFLFRHFFPVHTIGHPAPKSFSGDVIHHASVAVANFACKLNTEPITWATIQAEINKAKHMTPFKPVCLIITAFELGAQIVTAMEKESHLLLGKGDWYAFSIDLIS